jgi:hypothetical protein
MMKKTHHARKKTLLLHAPRPGHEVSVLPVHVLLSVHVPGGKNDED